MIIHVHIRESVLYFFAIGIELRTIVVHPDISRHSHVATNVGGFEVIIECRYNTQRRVAGAAFVVLKAAERFVHLGAVVLQYLTTRAVGKRNLPEHF